MESPPFPAVAVFCGASSGNRPEFESLAFSVGKALAEQGITVVYGGGSVGLMGALANGALSVGGTVHGVITRYLDGCELGHTGINELEVVETMLERKARMAELSDAFISLPGGFGTLDELYEMLTWSLLSIHNKPNGILNFDGFYDSLKTFLFESQVGGGFIRKEDAANLIFSDNLVDLLAEMRQSHESGNSTLYT